ncbi:MAG TPA: NUDIX domain-containing protein [Polyangiaceae bacterium]|nr:NUDIX domain-containing protein [Polyangiaceae bacterium]
MVTRSHKVSAGILVYRRTSLGVELLLAHPGGPIFRRRDAGVWTIPKGEIEPGEEPLAAAQRELKEETGFSFEGPFLPLGTVKQKSGKVVHAFACEGSVDPTRLESNRFRMEWPPRSGKTAEFPELDRADYFDPVTAREKLNEAQGELVERLLALLESK